MCNLCIFWLCFINSFDNVTLSSFHITMVVLCRTMHSFANVFNWTVPWLLSTSEEWLANLCACYSMLL